MQNTKALAAAFMLAGTGVAQAASISFSAEIITLQGGLGAPFAIGQTITTTVTIGALGTDLASANTLTAYSGISEIDVTVGAAGFTGSADPGRAVNHPAFPSPSWVVDGLVLTKNTAGDDTLDIQIGFLDSGPTDWGGNATGVPDPVSGKTLDGLSITLRDADGIAFDSLGTNPDPVAALNLALANLGLFRNNVNDRAEVRLHFTPDAGTNQPSKITATIVPVPAAAWLFGSALGLLGWIRRRAT